MSSGITDEKTAVRNVFQKLADLREYMRSVRIEKSGTNRYVGFSYFELGDFLPAVLKKCNEIGLIGLYSAGTDGIARLEIVNTENPADRLVFTCPLGSAQLRGCYEIQNIGACITYTRRYLWIIALELSEHDELDALSGNDREEKREAPKKNTPGVSREKKNNSRIVPGEELARLEDAVNRCESVEELNALWKAYGMDLPDAEADWLTKLCAQKKRDLETATEKIPN